MYKRRLPSSSPESNDGNSYLPTPSRLSSNNSSYDSMVCQLLTLINRESQRDEEARRANERSMQESLRGEIRRLEKVNHDIETEYVALSHNHNSTMENLAQSKSQLQKTLQELETERTNRSQLQVSEAEYGLQLATVLGNHRTLEVQNHTLQKDYRQLKEHHEQHEQDLESAADTISSLRRQLKEQHKASHAEIKTWKKKVEKYDSHFKSNAKASDLAIKLQTLIESGFATNAEAVQEANRNSGVELSQFSDRIGNRVDSLVDGNHQIASELSSLSELMKELKLSTDSANRDLTESLQTSSQK